MTSRKTDHSPTPATSARNHGLLHTVILIVAFSACYGVFFRHPIPVHPDEAEFMEGIGFPDHYPVHHPGYPLWVLLGTVGRFAGFDAYTSFAVWSIASGIAAVALSHRLFRHFMSAHSAFLFAAAFGVGPIAWYSATTALTYSLSAAMGIAVVLMSVKSVRQKRPGLVVSGAVILALSIFVRADQAVYSGPVLLYAMIARRSPALFLRSSAILVTGIAIFLLTVNALYLRGDAGEVAARAAHTREILLGSSVLRAGLIDGLARNIVKIAAFAGWGLGIALPAFLVAVVVLVRQARRKELGAQVVFFWLLPGLTFLACFHVAPGYCLMLLPAFYLGIGVAVERRFGWAAAERVGAAIVFITVVQFVGYPWSTDGAGLKRTLDDKIAYISRLGLQHADDHLRVTKDGDFWRTPAHSLNDTPTAP